MMQRVSRLRIVGVLAFLSVASLTVPPRAGYTYRLPPGIAKKYAGGHPKYWKQSRRW
jgi:hypothetical protein